MFPESKRFLPDEKLRGLNLNLTKHYSLSAENPPTPQQHCQVTGNLSVASRGGDRVFWFVLFNQYWGIVIYDRRKKLQEHLSPKHIWAKLKSNRFSPFRGSWRIFGDSSVTLAQWWRARDSTNLVIHRSQLRFRPKTRHLRFIWIWANRPSSKGSKLLFPVIKANQIKFWPWPWPDPPPSPYGGVLGTACGCDL